MKTAVVTVGSVTQAIKARKLLAREGIMSKLVKTDAGQRARGCAYGVEFSSKELFGVADVLRSNGIHYELYDG